MLKLIASFVVATAVCGYAIDKQFVSTAEAAPNPTTFVEHTVVAFNAAAEDDCAEEVTLDDDNSTLPIFAVIPYEEDDAVDGEVICVYR